MKYAACVNRRDAVLEPEREGLRLGARFLDYAEVKTLRPVNHRVMIDTFSGETVELSMLGFSFDGFWEELTARFGARSMEALFVEEKLLMRCDGEFRTARESGRGQIALYEDAVCILPQSCHALRIPLCFAGELRADGYLLHLGLRSGSRFTVGRMGYDTQPFFERAAQAAARVKQRREAALAGKALEAPFTEKGLFRTARPETWWRAAYGKGCCALELETGDDAATYLYRFSEDERLFALRLEEAMEAMGTHREIIVTPEEQLADKPLCRMAIERSEAVRFLRERSAGRLIHSAAHAQRLAEFLG